MSERTILLFPEFHNMELLENIRKQYDPLARLIRPHITLVFPFVSDLSNPDLGTLIEAAAAGIGPFPLRLSGIRKQEDAFGNYLFLDVKEGREELIQLHDRLYQGPLRPFLAAFPYCPHMTLGKLESPASLQAAYDNVKHISASFSTEITSVSVERIGEHGESILLMEKKLKA